MWPVLVSTAIAAISALVSIFLAVYSSRRTQEAQAAVETLKNQLAKERSRDDARLEPDQREDRLRLGGHCRVHHDFPALVAQAGNHRCLVNIEREILNRLLFHGSRPFLSFVVSQLQTYRKGRAFNMR